MARSAGVGGGGSLEVLASMGSSVCSGAGSGMAVTVTVSVGGVCVTVTVVVGDAVVVAPHAAVPTISRTAPVAIALCFLMFPPVVGLSR